MPRTRSKPNRPPFQWRHVVQLAAVTAVTAFAAGYVISDLDGPAIAQLPLIGLSVAAVLLIVWLAEIRVSRQRARNEAHPAARLTRTEYWQVYSDVLADLGGGGDGEPSGDIPPSPRRS